MTDEPHPYRTNDRRVIPWLLVGLVTIFGALYVAGYYVTSDRIPRGTTVDGVAIGGMTPAAAEGALRAGLEGPADVPITVVILALLLFLWNWRTAVISLIAIPLSLVAAVFVLYLRGATFNTMLLAGLVIALGAVIDDAIVDVENIARRLRQARQEGSDKSTIGDYP